MQLSRPPSSVSSFSECPPHPAPSPGEINLIESKDQLDTIKHTRPDLDFTFS